MSTPFNYSAIDAQKSIDSLVLSDFITPSVRKLGDEIVLTGKYYIMLNRSNPNSPLNTEGRIAVFTKLETAFNEQTALGLVAVFGHFTITVEYGVTNSNGQLCDIITLSVPVDVTSILGF